MKKSRTKKIGVASRRGFVYAVMFTMLLAGCGRTDSEKTGEVVDAVTFEPVVVEEESVERDLIPEPSEMAEESGMEADEGERAEEEDEAETETEEEIIQEEQEEEEKSEQEEAEPEEIAEPEGEAEKLTEPAEVQPAEAVPQESRRTLFVGDSRTIDMFADSDDELAGLSADGIVVYAKHGHGYGYMVDVVNGYGHDNFDVLVTWMGANDGGNFYSYETFYNGLLQEGKIIVVCTVGPTDDSTLAEWDHPNYENDKMVTFNNSLVSWAGQHGVRVIDLYSYISQNVTIDPADGIHYTPRPTSGIWQYIVASL